jgi:hypothetical protein
MQTISREVRGRIPRGEDMVKLAEALPDDFAWILAEDEAAKPRSGLTASEIRQALNAALNEMPAPVVEGLLWYLPRPVF